LIDSNLHEGTGPGAGLACVANAGHGGGGYGGAGGTGGYDGTGDTPGISSQCLKKFMLFIGKGGGTYGSISAVSIEGMSILSGVLTCQVGSSGGGGSGGASGGAVIFRAAVISIRNSLINCSGADGIQEDGATLAGRFTGGGSGILSFKCQQFIL
jgi:hypothetical protein